MNWFFGGVSGSRATVDQLALHRLNRSGRGYGAFFVYKKSLTLQPKQFPRKAILAFNVATHCRACWLERIRSLIHYIKRGAYEVDEATQAFLRLPCAGGEILLASK